MLDFQAARYLMDGVVPQQAGNDHPTSIPTGVFKTSDGFINLAVAGELIWKRLAETLKKPEWCDDERFAVNESRSRKRKLLNAEIEKLTQPQTSTYWVRKFNEAGVPAGDINDIGQVKAHKFNIWVWHKNTRHSGAKHAVATNFNEPHT